MKFSGRQKLYLAVILAALLPTVGVMVWGVAKSMQSSEFAHSVWDQQK